MGQELRFRAKYGMPGSPSLETAPRHVPVLAIPPWVHPCHCCYRAVRPWHDWLCRAESKGAMGSKWTSIQAVNQSQVNLEQTICHLAVF